MRVVNAFIFFDELDLLDIRLHELDPVVDLFVIVETLEHNANRERKPICLRPNWGVVQPFAHKIKYVVLEHVLPHYPDRAQNSGLAWEREAWQRNQIIPAVLEVAHPDDVVIITEGDEIPRAETIRQNRDILNTGIHQLEMDFFYYNVNRLVTEPWATAFAGTIHQIQDAGGPAVVRRLVSGRGNGEGGQYPWIKNCGWHFSTFGNLEHIRQKFSGFAHAYDPQYQAFEAKRDDKKLILDIASGRYLAQDRPNFTTWREADDPRLPVYFLNNPKKFEHMTDAFFKDKHKDVLGGYAAEGK
jgi:beta-1,4-mannosyl-glycoprotein beta-1,4-N-acetylglucosaminyltransferase